MIKKETLVTLLNKGKDKAYTVEEIILSQKQSDQLQAELKRKANDGIRYRTIRRYAGGVCGTCGFIPSKRVSFDMDGAQRIEWYCDKCIPHDLNSQ